MTEKERLAAFEKMLAEVQAEHTQLIARLDALKAAGKTRSATFRQYLGNKMTCQYILSLYQAHGLLDKNDGEVS